MGDVYTLEIVTGILGSYGRGKKYKIVVLTLLTIVIIIAGVLLTIAKSVNVYTDRIGLRFPKEFIDRFRDGYATIVFSLQI